MDVRRDAFLPTREEWPYYEFLSAVNTNLPTIQEMLGISMAAGREYRDIRSEAFGSDGQPRHTQAEIRRFARIMTRSRPRAHMYAVSILVKSQADLDDLRKSTNISRSAHFGPVVGGVHFTELLQAGANSTRHGREWWASVREAIFEWGDSDDAWQNLKPSPRFSKRQMESIHPIRTALQINATHVTDVNEFLACDILRVLSDENAQTFAHRLLSVAWEIAARSKRSMSALMKVAEALNVPEVMLIPDP